MTKLRLLLGSLAPGCMVAAVRVSESHPVWAVVLAVVAAVSVVSVVTLLSRRSELNEEPQKLTRVTEKSDQAPGYMLSFVFPFLFLSVDNWQDIAAYAAFATISALLIVRTELLFANPLLLIAGYHLYEIETASHSRAFLLVASERPLAGQTIGVVPLSGSALKLTSVHP